MSRFKREFRGFAFHVGHARFPGGSSENPSTLPGGGQARLPEHPVNRRDVRRVGRGDGTAIGCTTYPKEHRMTPLRPVLKAALIPVLLTALAACSPAPAELPDAAAGQAASASAAPAQAAVQPEPAAAGAAAAPVRTQGTVEIHKGSAPALPASADRYGSAEAVQLNAAPAAGSAVTDTAGFSLYRFDNDTADPSATTCAGDCAVKWPPLLVGAEASIYTDNVDAGLVGYVERPDGTCQVTIGGWPVYYFAGDTAPGEVRGQGIGDTWFAIDGQGKKATGLPAPSGAPAY
jgi:predicted lipoprotein with Yx(FWY)xxD motif